MLDETGSGAPLPLLAPPPSERGRRVSVTLFMSDADEPERPLLLSLYDVPEVGRRFRYQDLEWEIVEYRNGWLARLVVEEA